MADVTRIDALIQHTNKNGESLTDWTDPIPINLLVYDETNNLIKKGDGINSFNDLPVWLDFAQLTELANVGSYIENIFLDENLDKLIIIDILGHVSITTSMTNTELIDIINNLPTIIATAGGSNITVPIITGPIKKKINSSFELSAVSFSAYNGEQMFNYEWLLPDDSVIINNSISYVIPNDINLIGDILTFKCKGISAEFGFKSKFTTHEVEIGDSDGPVILSATYLDLDPVSSEYIVSIDEEEL